MKNIAVDAILIDSKNPARLVSFYKLLGVPIKEERHGPELHWGCMLNDLHFAIHKTKKSFSGNRMSISFYVNDVDKMVKRLKVKKVKIIMDPCDRPFGRLASVLDPDGNTVYIHKY